MEKWIIPTIGALVLYGLWAWFPKLATQYIDARSAWIYEAIGFGIATAAVALYLGVRPMFHAQGTLFAMLSGAAAAIGTLLFFIAIARTRASVVTTITALYPLITILLSFVLLKESLTLKHLAGIALGLLSIVFLAS